MKKIVFSFIFLFCSLIGYCQMSFTTPVGKGYKALTLIFNLSDKNKTLFYYNDVNTAPVLLTPKRDTVLNGQTLGLFTSPDGLKYFILMSGDLRKITIYDSKGALFANLANDSHAYIVSHPDSVTAPAPTIPPAVLSGLFKLLLLAI